MHPQDELETVQKIRDDVLGIKKCLTRDIRIADQILRKLCSYEPAINRLGRCIEPLDGISDILDLPIGWYDGSAEKVFRAKIAQGKDFSSLFDRSDKVSLILFREAFIRTYKDTSLLDSLSILCDLDRIEQYANTNCARSLLGNDFAFFHFTWTVSPIMDSMGKSVCILHPCNDVIILSLLFAAAAQYYVDIFDAHCGAWLKSSPIKNFQQKLKSIIAEQLFEWHLGNGFLLPSCQNSLRRPWIYDWQTEAEHVMSKGPQYHGIDSSLIASIYKERYLPAVRAARYSQGERCLKEHVLILEDAQQMTDVIFTNLFREQVTNTSIKTFTNPKQEKELWNEARNMIVKVGAITSGVQDIENEAHVLSFLGKYQLVLGLRSTIPRLRSMIPIPGRDIPSEDQEPKTLAEMQLLSHKVQRDFANLLSISSTKELIRYSGILVPMGDLTKLWKKAGLVHTSLTALSHIGWLDKEVTSSILPEPSDADIPTLSFEDIVDPSNYDISTVSWHGRTLMVGNKNKHVALGLKAAIKHGHSYLPEDLQNERFSIVWNPDITKGVQFFNNYVRKFTEGITYPNIRRSGLADFEHIIAMERDAVGFGLFARSVVEVVTVAVHAGLAWKAPTEVIPHAIKVGLWEVLAEEGGDMASFRWKWDHDNLDIFINDIEDAIATDILRLVNLVRIAELFIFALEGWL